MLSIWWKKTNHMQNIYEIPVSSTAAALASNLAVAGDAMQIAEEDRQNGALVPDGSN